LLIILAVCGCTYINGQNIIIDSIFLEGNKKTTDQVILRELDIQVNDTIQLSELDDRFEINKKRLLSTGLFNIVEVNIEDWNTETNHLSLSFKLKENWYIYPSIIWEYADRSFNVWWKDHRLNFARTNFGVRLDHLNLSGHKDRLKVKFQHGYTKKYEAIYSYPYFIGDWGLGGQLFYSTNKELGYKTENNQTLFYKNENEEVVLTRFRAGLSLTNRSNAFVHQTFRLEFHNNNISIDIAEGLNPEYFLNGATGIKFFYSEYDIQYDKRVFPTYPEGGYLLFFNIKKEGLGVYNEFNNFSVFGGFEKYFKLSKNLVYGGRVKAKVNLNRSEIGYGNNTGLGYGDEVRGYELYVVDGTDFLLTRTDLKYKLFSKIFDIKDFMFIKQFDQLPMTIWLRSSFDLGYVNEPTYKDTNFLANEWMIGGGPGIDILLYNNYIMKFEYNFNRLGESGFFIGASWNF
jgi:outer membrane protein assembly factor BamA